MSMNIAIKNNLEKSEISEILLLQDICNLVDKTHAKPKLSTDLNLNRAIPTFFLGREDDILVAFLTVFMSEGGIPSVTAFVHPSYRRQRRFSEMFNVMKTLYKGYGFNEFIFPINSLSFDGNKAAENFAAYGLMWPLFYTAVFYLAFVGILTLLFGYFEKKLSYYKA